MVRAFMIVAEVGQWALVAWRGQTVGKLLVGSRIVRGDGAAPGLVHGVLLREWFQALSLMFGGSDAARTFLGLGSLVDVVFIFGAGRRCLHDRIADTYVVDAARSAPAQGREHDAPEDPIARPRTVCAKCASANEADAAFCTTCGVKLKAV